jgi:chromosome segregation ATPase
MPQTAPSTPSSSSSLPVVRLEVRVGAGRPTVYEVGDGGFLIGSVPGCDLRLPGPNLAPVLALIARHSGGASLRKLAPVQPVLVNGRAVGSTYLDAGDSVTVGGVEIGVTVLPGEGGPPVLPAVPGDEAVTARRQALLDQVHQLEADRAEWFRRREEIEAECKRQTEAVDVLNARLRQQERELENARDELERREQVCGEAAQEVNRQRHELEGFSERAAKDQLEVQSLRNELTEIRQKLYNRYRARRDRLDKQQQGVRVAARRLQEQKKKLDTALGDVTRSQQEWAVRQAEIETVGGRLERDRKTVEEQQQKLAARQEDLHRELSRRVEEVQSREGKATEERTTLDQAQKQHQADLVRLDRIQATLDQRKKQLDAQALEVDKRYEQLQRDSRELEEQATQLDEWHNRLAAETERLAAQKQEQDAAGKQAEQRAAALEGQQAMLATLRTRLERMREELRRQEQSLGDQRVLQEAGEADFRQRMEEARKHREELDAELALHGQEKKQFEEKRTAHDADAAILRLAQQTHAGLEEEMAARKAQLEATAAEQSEQAGLLVARGQQLEALHAKLQAERQALKDREAAVADSEQMVSTLQEHLRKRGEDLAARERAQAEAEERLREAEAAIEARQKASEEAQRQASERLEGMRRELAARAAEIEALSQDVTRREEVTRAEGGRLEESAKSLTAQRQSLAAERIAWEVERQAAHEKEQQTRAELEAARAEAVELARQAPDMEARAAAALDRLTRAREQLREHLAEVHAYARQSRDDLEAAAKHVQAEAERMRQQELGLHVARDEHRLAVAAFRQQLIEWQGQVGEMKQTLRQGETRLDRQQAAVNEQAERIASDAARLAEQAEELQAKERQVAERRGEVDRHLTDMREWYRRKMRELSGVDAAGKDADADDAEAVVVRLPAPEGEAPPAAAEAAPPAGHSILSLTPEVDPGDRQLGELLRTLGLVDADTLAALLLEARRQRKSLRQLLLAGNYLTLYQMALIEAGSLDGLILGPVRVIDRLQATPHEAVFRVFDPRSEREAVLRHLAEAEMHDAVRPDEFRQRFGAAAAVKHEHVAATYEVLEVAGRPAVLQEWLTGVPGGDWPALAAAPGVWFRLVSQAALGLEAVHAAGLVHGHLHAGSFVMTGGGVLKLCGAGEPLWLAGPAEGQSPAEPGPAGDLLALGRVAAEWAAGSAARKGAKARPLPEPLQAVLAALTADDPAKRPPSAAALLAELERAGGDVPANAAAWERFVRQVREQSADPALRRSA